MVVNLHPEGRRSLLGYGQPDAPHAHHAEHLPGRIDRHGADFSASGPALVVAAVMLGQGEVSVCVEDQVQGRVCHCLGVGIGCICVGDAPLREGLDVCGIVAVATAANIFESGWVEQQWVSAKEQVLAVWPRFEPAGPEDCVDGAIRATGLETLAEFVDRRTVVLDCVEVFPGALPCWGVKIAANAGKNYENGWLRRLCGLGSREH